MLPTDGRETRCVGNASEHRDRVRWLGTVGWDCKGSLAHESFLLVRVSRSSLRSGRVLLTGRASPARVSRSSLRSGRVLLAPQERRLPGHSPKGILRSDRRQTRFARLSRIVSLCSTHRVKTHSVRLTASVRGLARAGPRTHHESVRARVPKPFPSTHCRSVTATSHLGIDRRIL